MLARPASAGLRPLYGGELVLTVPSAPQTTVPARAWSSAEVAIACAVGAPLSAVLDGEPQVSANGRQVRLPVRADATWADGTPLDAKALAKALAAALDDAPVSLPPFTFHAEKDAVVAELPMTLPDPARYLALPWLRLWKGGEGGAFRARDNAIEAHASGLGGRAFADRVRVDVREGRKLEPEADGLVLGRPGLDGRPVFALPGRRGTVAAALAAELPSLNREALAKLFVRGWARVPDEWPAPAAGPKVATTEPVTILIDAGERDLRMVAERLQVLLRDRKLTARISAEPRDAYFERLRKRDYDLALVALPPAPVLVQAATLARLDRAGAADQVWREAAAAKDLRESELLRAAAKRAGAILLYVEGGAVQRGARVRGPAPSAAWDLDLGNAWVVPPGMASP